ALPRLAFRQAASPHLEVKTGSATSKTQLVADMDRVIQTEFKKDFQGILTRAIISTTTKAVAQYALEKNNNSSWAAVAMASGRHCQKIFRSHGCQSRKTAV
ncbi:MAG: hypothetical protein ACYSOI_02320, partial [Planctomycetota bacterium]